MIIKALDFPNLLLISYFISYFHFCEKNPIFYDERIVSGDFIHEESAISKNIDLNLLDFKNRMLFSSMLAEHY